MWTLTALAGVQWRLINVWGKIFCWNPHSEQWAWWEEQQGFKHKEMHRVIWWTIQSKCSHVWYHYRPLPLSSDFFFYMLIRHRVHHIFAGQIHDLNLWDINLQAQTVCFLDLNDLKKENRFTLIWYWFPSLLLQRLQAFHTGTVLVVIWRCR